MARTKRDNMKRQLGHTLNNLLLAQQHLSVVWSEFEKVHPDQAEQLSTVLTGLEIMKDSVEKFAEQAFGYVPEDLEKWRDVPEK